MLRSNDLELVQYLEELEKRLREYPTAYVEYGVDVTQAPYNAAGDGVTDDGPAIQAAIDAIPDQSIVWCAGCGIPQNGWTLLFPSRAGSACYRINTQITIPGNKCVTLSASTPNGARLQWGGVGSYMFSAATGLYNVWSCSGIVFDGGGVDIQTDSRRGIYFDRCMFVRTPDYAIRSAGMSVVGCRITDCGFYRTNGGILVDQANDLWSVERCVFSRLEQTGVYSSATTGSTEIHIRDCNFEIKGAGAVGAAFPHVHALGGSFVTVDDCRFGAEVSGADGPPKYGIAIGDLAGGEDGSLAGYHITNNRFYGRIGGPTATSAAAAIYLGRSVRESTILGNMFRQYGFLVEEDYGGAPTGRDNVWSANTVDTTNYPGDPFSGAALGFRRDDIP